MTLDDLEKRESLNRRPREAQAISNAELDKIVDALVGQVRPAPTGDVDMTLINVTDDGEEFEADDDDDPAAPTYQELMIDLEMALEVCEKARSLLLLIKLDPDLNRAMDLASAVEVQRVYRDLDVFLKPWDSKLEGDV
jgi:hypothetical protein